MSEIVYAVHTRACTYLLDDEGICRWVLSRSGARSDDRCIGAQFVAALDLHSKGGLVGELRLGSSALFVRSEDDRFVLIRTKPIEHVEIRGADASEPFPAEPEAVVLPDRLAVAAVFNAPAPAPLPEPPSARVILREPRTEPPPGPGEPSGRRETTQRMITEPFPALPKMVQPPLPAMYPPAMVAPPPMISSAAQPPSQPPPAPGTTRSFPRPPPREPAARRRPRDEPTATQPLPPPGPVVPSGPVPAWPPMLAPPPPPAEMVPLGPARPHLPSAEELDAEDLEEIGDDEQVYSMEVTLTMPLWPGAPQILQRRP